MSPSIIVAGKPPSLGFKDEVLKLHPEISEDEVLNTRHDRISVQERLGIFARR